jgi:hypothetical protein
VLCIKNNFDGAIDTVAGESILNDIVDRKIRTNTVRLGLNP